VTFGKRVMMRTDFDDAVAQVREALARQGFGVLTEIDVQATLRTKLGVEMEPLLLLGACNPPLAHQALEVDRSIGLLLPCTVAVRSVDDGTLVEILDPQTMVELTGQPALAPVADEAGRRLDAVVAELREG
jgi:uncharacterized protein (DUF302 family)